MPRSHPTTHPWLTPDSGPIKPVVLPLWVPMTGVCKTNATHGAPRKQGICDSKKNGHFQLSLIRLNETEMTFSVCFFNDPTAQDGPGIHHGDLRTSHPPRNSPPAHCPWNGAVPVVALWVTRVTTVPKQSGNPL